MHLTEDLTSHDLNAQLGAQIADYRDTYPTPANLYTQEREEWLQANLPDGAYDDIAAVRWQLVTENRGFVSMLVERRQALWGLKNVEWDDLVDAAMLALFYRTWDYDPTFRFTTFATKPVEKSISDTLAVYGSYEKRTNTENIHEALRLAAEYGHLPVEERAPYAKIPFLRKNPKMLAEWTAVAHGASNPIYLDEQFDNDEGDTSQRQVADPNVQRGFDDDDQIMRVLRSFLSDEDAHIAVLALGLDGQGVVRPKDLDASLTAMGVTVKPMTTAAAARRIRAVQEKMQANSDTVALMLADA